MTDAVLERRLGWMDRGSTFFEAALSALSDEELRAPSALPGWTRLHVVSHMARNARGLMNLLRWAETGKETPMYPSRAARDADIETGAMLPPGEVRADALEAGLRFREAVAALPTAAWGAEVRTTLGQPVPAIQIPWMRVREVWVHAIDLGSGASFEDVDAEVAGAMLDEAVERAAGIEGCPSVLLVPSPPHGATLSMGNPSKDALTVRGSVQAMVGWILGRTAGAGLESAGPLADPPAWL